jgi:hypothetical protein
MKMPAPEKIIRNRFEDEYSGLIDTLGGIINPYLEQMGLLFNKRIDFDNLNQEVRDISIIVDANGNPLNSFKFTANINSRPKGFLCIAARASDGSNATNTPFISFDYFGNDSKTIEIKHISGLQANKDYTLTVIVF